MPDGASTSSESTAAAHLVAAAARAAAAAHPEADETLVLASETVPAGVEVARHYMQARGIPAENLLVVKAPPTRTAVEPILSIRIPF